jgi:hypothetical protein
MIEDQPDLLRKDPERDMDLWRHLFAPDDLVHVGNACAVACAAAAAESCSRNTWNYEVIVATAAVCWPPLALLRGTACKEPMTRAQACEGVLGRLIAAGIEIAMVVEDGDGALECLLDPVPGSFPMHSRGRCPRGMNSRTELAHRVVWAHPITRIACEKDDWSVRETE